MLPFKRNEFERRMEDGLCLRCGDTLIVPFNDYRCCTGCTFLIEKARYDVQKKAERKHKFKKTGIIIRRGQIARQTTPIGRTID